MRDAKDRRTPRLAWSKLLPLSSYTSSDLASLLLLFTLSANFLALSWKLRRSWLSISTAVGARRMHENTKSRRRCTGRTRMLNQMVRMKYVCGGTINQCHGIRSTPRPAAVLSLRVECCCRIALAQSSNSEPATISASIGGMKIEQERNQEQGARDVQSTCVRRTTAFE